MRNRRQRREFARASKKVRENDLRLRNRAKLELANCYQSTARSRCLRSAGCNLRGGNCLIDFATRWKFARQNDVGSQSECAFQSLVHSDPSASVRDRAVPRSLKDWELCRTRQLGKRQNLSGVDTGHPIASQATRPPPSRRCRENRSPATHPEQIGAQKIRADATTLLTLSVLAGAFIALGAMFATAALAGTNGVVPLALTWPVFLNSLIPVTLGNIVGGGVLVGGVYWFIYLRPRTG